MANNRLIISAIANYKNAPISSWILGLTTGIIIAAVVAIDLIVPGLILITFPFIIVPMIFSASLQHIIFKTKGQLTVRSSLKSFGLYYNGRFFGSFSILSSFFKSLLVFLVLEMTVSFIASTVMQATSTQFMESINMLYDLLESASFTIDDINYVFSANNEILLRYTIIVMMPSLFIAVLFMLYNMSRSSIVIYYKMQIVNVDSRFAKFVYADVLRGARGKLLKDYLMLNWPLFVLLLIGFAGGCVGGFFWKHDIMFMVSCGFLGGAALAMFFLPFYFSNQEAFYEHHMQRFNKSTGAVTQFLINSLQNNIDLSIEEKEKIEKDFNNITNPLEDNDEDDNKKDPDGPQ